MVQKLIEETRLSCEEYLPKLIQATSRIANNIQSGNVAAAMSILPDTIEGLQWVIEAVKGIQQNDHKLGIVISDLTKYFKELERAMEVRDYVFIADSFEYEITPILKDWLLKVKHTEQ